VALFRKQNIPTENLIESVSHKYDLRPINWTKNAVLTVAALSMIVWRVKSRSLNHADGSKGAKKGTYLLNLFGDLGFS
jgi:hypothetical protein